MMSLIFLLAQTTQAAAEGNNVPVRIGSFTFSLSEVTSLVVAIAGLISALAAYKRAGVSGDKADKAHDASVTAGTKADLALSTAKDNGQKISDIQINSVPPSLMGKIALIQAIVPKIRRIPRDKLV